MRRRGVSRVQVAQLSPGMRCFGWAFTAGGTLALGVVAWTRSWASAADLHSSSVAFGSLVGLWIVMATMGVRVRGGVLTARGFWFSWAGDPWAVRGASNQSGLVLHIRELRSAGPADRRLEIVAVEGSVLEQLRGNVRAAGAIRRLRNVQAATPRRLPEQTALRRRVRWELAAVVPAAVGAEWLLMTTLWRLG